MTIFFFDLYQTNAQRIFCPLSETLKLIENEESGCCW